MTSRLPLPLIIIIPSPSLNVSRRTRSPEEATPVIRPLGQDARPTSPVERRGPRGRRSRWRSHRPSPPGPQRGACVAARLCPLPGPFLPEHCPSFTNPAARRGHQIPCLFWTLWTFYVSQRCPRTALFPTFYRISSFVFSRTKTFIQIWNYLRVSKWWQNFHFWVNYPFKCISLHVWEDGWHVRSS